MRKRTKLTYSQPILDKDGIDHVLLKVITHADYYARDRVFVVFPSGLEFETSLGYLEALTHCVERAVKDGRR